MLFREPARPGPVTVSLCLAAVLFLLLLSGGCLATEPEELHPQPVQASPVATPAGTTAAPAVTRETPPAGPLPVVITSPRKTGHFTGGDYPPEVMAAVRDFTCGKTTDPITSYLRWESVRARTGPAESARIREQVSRIDYAVVNTTIRDDLRLYVGLTSEQARRVRNDSVFAENGYLIATYDPSVIYRRLWSTGRDRDGYVTMCVLDFHKGDRILFVNVSEREFLLPRGGAWDVTGEEVYDQLAFTADSVPRYDDIVQTDVRMIYTREHL